MLKLPSNFAPKVRALINMFKEGLVDQENRDTFKGIEKDVIDGFFERTIAHHEDKKKVDDNFIDAKLFFNAFEDKLGNYKIMKNRFEIVNKTDVFQKYLFDEEIEKELAEQIN